MRRLDRIEENTQLIFHSLENHDFLFLVSIGTVPLLQFISKVQNTKYLFISDDRSIATRFKDIPYQTSIYDSRFSAAGSAWLTYDLCTYLISEDSKFLELFDFVILDGVDNRDLNTDYLLSLISNLQMKGKFIVPTRSGFKIELYTNYIEQFGYTTNVLTLFEQPSRNIYYLPTEPTDIHKEILKTIHEILQMDQSSYQYDILVILSSYGEVHACKNQLIEADIKHDFSILTDTQTYNVVGAHRRIILATDTKLFGDIDHKIRYIVDSGMVKVENFDDSGLEFYENKRINRNFMNQNIAILTNENSSYFGMFVEENLADFEYGINHCFAVHLLYLLKIGFKVENFEFLKAPRQEIIRNALTFLIYLGLVIIEDGGINITDLGQTVLKYQIELNIPSLSLFTALSSSNRFKCTKELLKISSVLTIVNANLLSKDIKNNGHKTTVPQSDFLTVLNIFDSIIENEQHISQSRQNHHQYRVVSSKESKKQILHCYKQLRNKLNHPVNVDKANEDDIHKCLFFGFQLHASIILKNVSNQGSMQLTIEPILKRLDQFETDQDIKILVKDDYDRLETEYENNDIIIYHSLEQDRIGLFYHTNIGSKIDKRLIHELSLPLYKFQ